LTQLKIPLGDLSGTEKGMFLQEGLNSSFFGCGKNCTKVAASK
jgi:hypothetical protein